MSAAPSPFMGRHRVSGGSRELALWLGVIVTAWLAAYWLEMSGEAHVLHHHTIYHSGQILAGGLALLAAWQVMTAAMMLPGTLPSLLRLPATRERLAFLATYAMAWTCFAAVAFAGDMGLHSLVHSWPPAARYEGFIPAAVLLVAAAYEVSPWKATSLAACRRPAAGAFRYARHCVASGWALMLIMFSAGVADIAWMAVLALAMVAEKTLRPVDTIRHAVAASLALLAAASLLGAHVI